VKPCEETDVPLAPIDRELPTDEARDLIELTREVTERELIPRVAKAEEAAEFPRDLVSMLGELGLMSLPYPERYGGGGQPAAVYLQVLEELARGYVGVAMSVSVHVLACHGIAEFGSDRQRETLLPEMLSGHALGAYCQSEPHSGSDPAAMRTRARRHAHGAGYRVTGDKAWITHGPVADFYLLLARTSDDGSHGISAFHVPADTAGISALPPEHKMGLTSSPTSGVRFDDVAVDADQLIGREGQGFSIAMSALDTGRLGIAACAVGLAQAALDAAADYARQRQAFGRTIDAFQGVSFLLADAAAQIVAARQLYLYAARRKDAGLPYATEASMAKLTATDAAMAVTTNMVQVLGGAGYVTDYPVERYMREAKVLQIVEGTNQIQRVVIARSLRGSAGRR
jgi:alkylation response protein AidB-like acyl-CoA dehydrogenase